VSKVYEVVVVATVEAETSDEAMEFVRAELLSKLGVGEPVWQTDQPHILPRWQVTSVRQATRQDERGVPDE
jgi:hypothetical protein